MTNVWYVKNILANCNGTCICQYYISKSRIALQVARKIAPCDRAVKELQLIFTMQDVSWNYSNLADSIRCTYKLVVIFIYQCLHVAIQ